MRLTAVLLLVLVIGGVAALVILKTGPRPATSRETSSPTPDNPVQPETPASTARPSPRRGAPRPANRTETPRAKENPERKRLAIAGTVRSVTGAPIPGALVHAFSRRLPGRPWLNQTAKTDPAGRFGFLDVDPGIRFALVEVKAAGYFSERKRVEVGEECSFVLGLPGSPRGRVTRRGGEPCGRARVYLSGASPAASETDQEGRFRFDALKPGTYALLVQSRRRTRRGRSAVTVREGRETVADLTLGDALRVRGRVVDAATRAPLAEATVTNLRQKESAATDATGWFTLEDVGNGARLRIEAMGYATTLTEVQKPSRDGNEIRAEYPLEPEAVVRGRVVDPSGEPVAQASVKIMVGGTTFGWPPAKTAEDGQFVLRGLPAGEDRRLHASKKGYVPARSPHLVLRPGQVVTGVVLTLGAGATLCGRVVDGDGAAVTAAFIELIPLGEAAAGWRGGKPDNDGVFHMERLAAGRYRVEIRAKGFEPQARNQVQLAEGEETKVDFILQRGLTISGRVVDPDGRPVPRVSLSAVALDYRSSALSIAHAQSDAEGRFELVGLSPGDYRLNVLGRNLWVPPGQRLQVPAGARNVELRVIRARGVLRGFVRDAATQAPIPRFRLSLSTSTST